MRAPSLSQAEPGFTILEVVVALLIIAGAAAGVAGLFVTAIRSTAHARTQTTTTALAIQKMEQLRALSWGLDESGATTGDVTTDTSRDRPGAGGPGLGPSPAGSLDGNLPGYVDYLDGGGRWVGTGASPPPEAAYVRRWSVDPLPDDPADTLVLQVLVVPVRHADAVAGAASGRLPGDARMVSAVTRKAW